MADSMSAAAARVKRPRLPGYAPRVPFASIDELESALAGASYLPDRGLSTALYLSLKLEKPLLLEGEAGVGKTEAAKAIAQALGARLIRLQCYEGLDVAHAVYEWNYARQLLHIRAAQEGTVDEAELFGPEFLIRRPLLEAVEAEEPVVLLIDEIDRADEEFEAFLLEVLSDFQITIPELGTIEAKQRPYVILTSNRTRELHDALKRRCLFHWIGHPVARARDRDREAARAGRAGAARRRGGRVRRGAAPARPAEAAGARGDDRLGAGADGARPAGARRRERARRRSGRCSSTTRTCSRSATRRWPASSPAPVPGSAVVRHIVTFGRVLREAGLEVGPGRVSDALRGLDAVELARQDDVYWTLRQTLVSRREDIEAFDRAFHAWFLARRRAAAGRDEAAAAARRAPQGRRRPGPGPELDGGDTSLGTWSEEELLRTKDFAVDDARGVRAREAADPGDRGRAPAAADAAPPPRLEGPRTRRARARAGVARDGRRPGRARVPQPQRPRRASSC